MAPTDHPRETLDVFTRMIGANIPSESYKSSVQVSCSFSLMSLLSTMLNNMKGLMQGNPNLSSDSPHSSIQLNYSDPIFIILYVYFC
jgi:hypothetical protein